MRCALLAGFVLVAANLPAGSSPPGCPPPEQWQQRYGTCGVEWLQKIKQLPDGGYVFAGEVSGYLECEPGTGNMTLPPVGQGNMWLVRTDGAGNMLWDRLYGGPSSGFLVDLVLTPDGGFLLGQHDFRVIRLDPHGNQLWERSYGGGGSDYLTAIQPTAAGGFILAGQSGVNRTGPTYAFTDYDFWLVLIDANGERLWDKSFGDRASDELKAFCNTHDGGFAFAGGSFYYPELTEHASLFRLDGNGNVLWQKSLGDSLGVTGVRETSEGHLVIGGTQETSDTFSFALMRLDAAGNLLWQKTYGGSSVGGADLRTMDITADGGFILGGTFYSAPGGDKTDPHLDRWVLRVDSQGNKLWELALGGPSDDHVSSLQVTADGGFIIGGTIHDHWSGIETFGLVDFWVTKLGPEDCDGDGVPDLQDLCPVTPAGAVVNARGCSIPQLVPCNGPWRNHAHYLRAILRQIAKFLRDDLITHAGARQILREAIKSDCGRRRR